MILRGFVVMRGGDRLHFEFYGFVTGQPEGFSKASLGVLIVFFCLRSDEADGTAGDNRTDFCSELRLGFLPQVA